MNKYHFLSRAVYSLCSLLVIKGSRPSDAAAHYFENEVQKSREFNDQFGLDVKNKTVLDVGCNVGGYVLDALNNGAKFVFGVEVNEARCEEAERLLADHYQERNYRIVNADSRDMPMIEDSCTDIVVSDAALEHIQNVDKLFSETYRILKPSGKAYIATSPLWFAANGGHLRRYIPIPWVHLILPEWMIIEVLEMQMERGDFPKSACENIIVLYKTIGRLSLRRIRDSVNGSGLHLVSLRNVSRHPLKRFLIKFPVLEEFFAGGIMISLQKLTDHSI